MHGKTFAKLARTSLQKKRKDSVADVVHTDFPISARLVIPGCSKNNYRHISEDWKNGTQDLSDLHGAAYILGRRKKPTGPHLLLVSQKQLKQAAASAVTKSNWIRKQLGIGKSHVSHKRSAKILGRQHSSKLVIRTCCKGK